MTRLRRVPVPLTVLLVIAAAQGIAWSIATAPFQGPDEIAHFSYVQNLAERGNAPSFATGDGAESRETATALLWTNLLASVGMPHVKPGTTSADLRRYRSIANTLPADARENAGGPNAVAKNPPLYYLYESLPYRAARGWSVFDRLFVMRLFNVLLFLGTVLFAWLAAAELYPDQWRRTAVCAFVSLQPELAFLSGAINPDSMLAIEWAAFVFAGLRLLIRGPTALRVFGVLAAVVASALTQGRGLPLAPAGIFVIALALWRHRPLRVTPLAGVGAGAALAAVALEVYHSTLGPASTAYGQEISFHGAPFRIWQFISQTWQFYLPRLPGMDHRLGPPYGAHNLWVDTFYGVFGSLDVHFPGWVYNAVEGALTCVVVGLVVAVFLRRGTLRWDVAAFLAVTFTGLMLFLHLASYRNLLGTQDPLIVGRYLVPLLVPMALAIVFAVGTLPRRVGPYVMCGVLAAEAMLCLTALGLSVERFYA